MKNKLIIGYLIFISISCTAQIIPVEKHMEYLENNTKISDGSYIKDVNNVLSKFTGIWKGNFTDKSYEFRIDNYVRDFLGIKKDALRMSYIVKDSSGNILENTTALSNNNIYIIKGRYLNKDGYYVFYYQGRNSNCGQNGNVYISVFGDQNEKMQLFLYPDGNIIDCTTGPAEQLLPTEAITLNKQ